MKKHVSNESAFFALWGVLFAMVFSFSTVLLSPPDAFAQKGGPAGSESYGGYGNGSNPSTSYGSIRGTNGSMSSESSAEGKGSAASTRGYSAMSARALNTKIPARSSMTITTMSLSGLGYQTYEYNPGATFAEPSKTTLNVPNNYGGSTGGLGKGTNYNTGGSFKTPSTGLNGKPGSLNVPTSGSFTGGTAGNLSGTLGNGGNSVNGGINGGVGTNSYDLDSFGRISMNGHSLNRTESGYFSNMSQYAKDRVNAAFNSIANLITDPGAHAREVAFTFGDINEDAPNAQTFASYINNGVTMAGNGLSAPTTMANSSSVKSAGGGMTGTAGNIGKSNDNLINPSRPSLVAYTASGTAAPSAAQQKTIESRINTAFAAVEEAIVTGAIPSSSSQPLLSAPTVARYNAIVKPGEIGIPEIAEKSISLQIGSTGKYVEALQRYLSYAGFYSGSIDGAYGSGTAAAVRAYQNSKGLSQDGVVGPQTRTALGGDAGIITKNTIKELQANLNLENPSFRIAVTGVFDEATKAALRDRSKPSVVMAGGVTFQRTPVSSANTSAATVSPEARATISPQAVRELNLFGVQSNLNAGFNAMRNTAANLPMNMTITSASALGLSETAKASVRSSTASASGAAVANAAIESSRQAFQTLATASSVTNREVVATLSIAQAAITRDFDTASTINLSNTSTSVQVDVQRYILDAYPYARASQQGNANQISPRETRTSDYTSNTLNAVTPQCDMIIFPTSIAKGDTATLFWSSSNASSVRITNSFGPAAATFGPNGSSPVTPQVTGTPTYTALFTAANGKTVTCKASVTVTGTADSTNTNTQQNSTDTSNETPARETSSSNNTQSQENTTYSAYDSNFNTTQNGNALQCAMSIAPTSIQKGATATLSWSSSNASSVRITNSFGPAAATFGPNGSSPVTPQVTGTPTYTGVFSGKEGQKVTCSASVRVN